MSTHLTVRKQEISIRVFLIVLIQITSQTLGADAEPCPGDNACVYVCDGPSLANDTVKHAPQPR